MNQIINNKLLKLTKFAKKTTQKNIISDQIFKLTK